MSEPSASENFIIFEGETAYTIAKENKKIEHKGRNMTQKKRNALRAIHSKRSFLTHDSVKTGERFCKFSTRTCLTSVARRALCHPT